MHWKCFPNKAMVFPPLMPHRYEMCSCLQLTYYRMESKLLNNPITLPILAYLFPSLCPFSTLCSLLPLSFWSRGVVPRVVGVGKTESCTVTGSHRQSRTSTDQWNPEGTFIQLDTQIHLQLVGPQGTPTKGEERD